MTPITLLLAALSAASPAAPSRLEQASALSEAASSAASADSARRLAAAALEGGASPVQAVPGNAARPPLTVSQGAAVRAERPEPPPPAQGKKSLAERRAEHRAKTAASRFWRSVGLGIAGFLGGALLGGLAGAVGAAAFLIMAPNPDLKILKWFLLLPAIAVGAVVGQLAGPFIGAAVLAQGKPYEL